MVHGWKSVEIEPTFVLFTYKPPNQTKYFKFTEVSIETKTCYTKPTDFLVYTSGEFLLFVSLKKLRLLCKKILRNNCQVADRNVLQMYNSVLLFLKYVLDSADLSKQKTIICAATDNKFN